MAKRKEPKRKSSTSEVAPGHGGAGGKERHDAKTMQSISSQPEAEKGKDIDDENNPENPQSVISSSSEGSEEGANDMSRNGVPATTLTAASSSDAKDLTRANITSTALVAANPSSLFGCCSRLFVPYRTVGIVSSGRPFFLIPHQNSANSVVCVPIGDRFQFMQTDKLQSVMVSQTVPHFRISTSTTEGSRMTTSASSFSRISATQLITHVVADATLSVTIVAHQAAVQSHGLTPSITLYQRVRPMVTRLCSPKKSTRSRHSSPWSIVDLLHLGRTHVDMQGEKLGRKEYAAIIAVILSRPIVAKQKNWPRKRSSDEDDGVPIFGEDESESESDEGHGDDEDESVAEDSDAESEPLRQDDTCHGQIVLYLATRTALNFHRRIRLDHIPDLIPQSALHPATYVNKIVVGGSDGQGRPAMCLVNIRTSQLIHVFKCLNSSMSETATITTMEQSPAVDTVAIGTNTGQVHLVNLRHDKKLFTLYHKGSKTAPPIVVTSISFRNDGAAMKYAVAPMAVGRSDGTVTIWDLSPPAETPGGTTTGRTILCEMHRLHAGGIAKIQYLPQEPLLLSIGTQTNSILMHIFDSPDHSGRLLRQRTGHSAPPKLIRYLHPGAGAGGGILVNASDGTDAAACKILSTGGADRTLRVFSTVRTVQDKQFSQGVGLGKRARQFGMPDVSELLLPPVTAMATAEARSREWGDLVTIHENHAMAYVWSTQRGAQSGPVLRQVAWNISTMKQRPPPTAHSTAVTMSSCGNFALVGTAGGIIYKYNIQSGQPRGSYPPNEEPRKWRSGQEIGSISRSMKMLDKDLRVNTKSPNLDKVEIDAEEQARRHILLREKLQVSSHLGFAVTGIAVDNINKTMISVGADAKLIVWSFASHAPMKRSPYILPAPATKLCHVRDSDLAAVAMNDFSVVLFDCATLSIVRRFGKGTARHGSSITDLGFSPDGRALYTSSLDSTMRVWDVPTNACIDWLRFQSHVTSFTISPTGEFLSTTHAGKLGISMWSDRSFYQTVHVDGRELSEPFPMDEPVPAADETETSDGVVTVAHIVSKELPSEETSGKDERHDSLVPKEKGLITLSGLPPAHWKNLFHLELVKERNKPKEPPKKPPSAPFFLQWRGGETLAEAETTTKQSNSNNEGNNANDEEWAAAWSDDEEGNSDIQGVALKGKSDEKRSLDEDAPDTLHESVKRPKITHHRSHLAFLLMRCSSSSAEINAFSSVTEYMATMGPSGIDVALSSLCSGSHDLEEGLPLLLLASRWLLETCESRERFEVINAYLHRFLFVHGSVLAGIEDRIDVESNISGDQHDSATRSKQLQIDVLQAVKLIRASQRETADRFHGKMQHALCLLSHFSRMI